jgi:hypothetical protein
MAEGVSRGATHSVHVCVLLKKESITAATTHGHACCAIICMADTAVLLPGTSTGPTGTTGPATLQWLVFNSEVLQQL